MRTAPDPVQSVPNATVPFTPPDSDLRAKYITLAQAGRDAPGQPHASAVWRWARKGIKSRSGNRVRLQHARIGGRVFTTVAWLEAFWADLARVDAQYFDAKVAAAESLPPRDPKYASPRRQPRSRAEKTPRAADRRQAELSAELDAEGL